MFASLAPVRLRCLLPLALLLAWSSALWAQDKTAKPAEKSSPEKKAEKLPDPEEIGAGEEPLVTADGVRLHGVFYGSNLGKEAVPIVLLHDFKEDGSNFASLAKFLQTRGHAVLVADLRGHGGSKKKDGTDRDVEITKAQLGRGLEMMIVQDMEKFKGFLFKRHDAGQLNIDKLCIVGVGMGAGVATGWAAFDWATQDLAGLRQSKYVKALVLISPTWTYGSFNLTKALQLPDLQTKLAVLILYGARSNSADREANRLHTVFEKRRDASKQDLFLGGLDTALQGSKLLEERSLKVPSLIDQFVQKCLVEREDLQWRQRK